MRGQWYADFTVSPDRVWAALTTDRCLGAWLDPGAGLQLKEGGKLSLPGGTQFRGLTRDVRLQYMVWGQQLVFSWTVKNSPGEVVFVLTANGKGSRLTVTHELKSETDLFPPRTNWGVLKHYWKQNLGCLKYYLELGRSVDRSPLQRRQPLEARLSVIVDATVERTWKALTSPEEMDKWLTKEAQVDLRPGGRITYGWDHGAARILDVSEPNLLTYTWVIGDDESLLTWKLDSVGDSSTRVSLRHSAFSSAYPDRAAGYTEGWLPFLLMLGIYLATGEKTHEWSNLNEEFNK